MSYLNNRGQLVEWGKTISPVRKVKVGLPQGSVLGPLLFLIYINDLPKNMSANDLTLFADDTSIMTVARSEEDIHRETEKATGEAREWFSSNTLKLNENKTKHLNITTGTENQIKCAKFLGLQFNSQFKWNSHVNYLQTKLSTAIYIVRQMKKIETYEATRAVYFAHFHSRATYGILVWG